MIFLKGDWYEDAQTTISAKGSKKKVGREGNERESWDKREPASRRPSPSARCFVRVGRGAVQKLT